MLSRHLVQNLFWRGLSYFTLLVLTILLARKLQAALSGEVNYLLNNLALLVMVLAIGLDSGLSYYAARQQLSRNAGAWFSLVYSIFWLLVLTLVLQQYMPAFTTFILLYVPGSLLLNLFSSLFQAAKNFVAPGAVVSACNLLLISLYFFAPLTEGQFVQYYFIGFFLQGLLLALWYFFSLPSLRIDWPRLSLWRPLLRYALSALLSNLIFFLVYRVDYWFVKTYCTPGELGNYIQASKLVQLFLFLPMILSSVIFSHTAQVSGEETKEGMIRLSRWMVILNALFILLIALFGEWLFIHLYGTSFDKMYRPFLLLAPGIFALSTQSLLSAWFAGRNQLRITILSNSIALLVIVAGNALFVPRFGIYAAAITSSIGYLVNMSISLNYFLRDGKTKWQELFVIRKSDLRYLTSLIHQLRLRP